MYVWWRAAAVVEELAGQVRRQLIVLLVHTSIVCPCSQRLHSPFIAVVPESKNGKEEFGCINVNIMYCTAKLGYVEEVYFVNMLQGN